MRWFCLLLGRYIALIDYLAVKYAWEAYKDGRPFEAVRILAAADKGVLAVSQEKAKELARRYPREVWTQWIDEHDLEILLGEVYSLWVHLLLSGHEAGEEVEHEMWIVPESDASGFNPGRLAFLINDWVLSDLVEEED
jgi:hypothetical protein